MSQTNRLFSRSFVALSAIQFLAFCNVAVFFPFYSYLRTLPIDPHWLGFLIGAYALSAVVVRPVISPLLHLGNARRWMFFSSIGFIGALPLYSLADGFWTMLAVRTLHGAFHAGLVSAMLAMVVAFIPKEKSGQAFALLSVNTLLPYAIIPPMLGPLQHMLGGYETCVDGRRRGHAVVLPTLIARPNSGSGRGRGRRLSSKDDHGGY